MPNATTIIIERPPPHLWIELLEGQPQTQQNLQLEEQSQQRPAIMSVTSSSTTSSSFPKRANFHKIIGSFTLVR